MRSNISSVFAVCLFWLAITPSGADQASGFPEVAAAIDQTLQTWLYDPAELDTAAYRRVKAKVDALALHAATDEEFIRGFRDIWQDGPFSHVELNKARQPAAELANYLDTLRVGGGGAQLAWQDDVAILTVNTMMGLDTIEEIDAAYTGIAGRDTSALIIDLRENAGGAFAVRPLVEHLVSTPFTAGVFVSRKWNASHRGPPGPAAARDLPTWKGWSITTFWADVQQNALTAIGFEPVEPVFAGPVYVLTSRHTASAAELATDALRSTKRALIVGEKTAGEMLSQKIFDIPGGFQLSLPIADYYSVDYGRIEGRGIDPDIETDAADALNRALEQLQN
jgi:carboxyl-terminal processing protease